MVCCAAAYCVVVKLLSAHIEVSHWIVMEAIVVQHLLTPQIECEKSVPTLEVSN